MKSRFTFGIVPIDFFIDGEDPSQFEILLFHFLIDQAQNLSEAAKWNFVSAAWQVRSHVRAALLNLYYSREDESLLARQESAQSNVVRLLEGQFAAGAVSSYEVTQARVALETTQLAATGASGAASGAKKTA